MFITKSLTKAFKFTTHLELEVNLNKMKGEVNSTNMKCFVTTRLFAHHKAHFLKLKMEAISSFLPPAGTDVAAPAATDRLSIPPTPMKQNSQKRCGLHAKQKEKEELISMWGTALRSQDSVLHHVFGCSTHNLTSAAPKLCFLHYK